MLVQDTLTGYVEEIPDNQFYAIDPIAYDGLGNPVGAFPFIPLLLKALPMISSMINQAAPILQSALPQAPAPPMPAMAPAPIPAAMPIAPPEPFLPTPGPYPMSPYPRGSESMEAAEMPGPGPMEPYPQPMALPMEPGPFPGMPGYPPRGGWMRRYPLPGPTPNWPYAPSFSPRPVSRSCLISLSGGEGERDDMLAQDPYTGYLHEIPDTQVEGYGQVLYDGLGNPVGWNLFDMIKSVVSNIPVIGGLVSNLIPGPAPAAPAPAVMSQQVPVAAPGCPAPGYPAPPLSPMGPYGQPLSTGFPLRRFQYPVGWTTSALPYTGTAPRRVYMRIREEEL